MEGLPTKLSAGRERPVLVREQKYLNLTEQKTKLVRRVEGTRAWRGKRGRDPRVL